MECGAIDSILTRACAVGALFTPTHRLCGHKFWAAHRRLRRGQCGPLRTRADNDAYQSRPP